MAHLRTTVRFLKLYIFVGLLVLRTPSHLTGNSSGGYEHQNVATFDGRTNTGTRHTRGVENRVRQIVHVRMSNGLPLISDQRTTSAIKQKGVWLCATVIGGMWKQSIFVTVHAVIIFRDSDVENTFFLYIPTSFLSINQIVGAYYEYVEMVASKAFHN